MNPDQPAIAVHEMREVSLLGGNCSQARCLGNPDQDPGPPIPTSLTFVFQFLALFDCALEEWQAVCWPPPGHHGHYPRHRCDYLSQLQLGCRSLRPEKSAHCCFPKPI